MKCQYDGNAAGIQYAGQYSGQHVFHVLQFLIGSDPQCLKHASRRMTTARCTGGAGCLTYAVFQIRSGFDRTTGLPPLHDLRGDASRRRLFAIGFQQFGQLPFIQCLQQLCGRATFADIKTHVQRTAGIETEASVHIGQLVRRKSQIQQHPVDTRNAKFLQSRLSLHVTAANEMADDIRRSVRLQSIFGKGQHHGITIHRNQMTMRSDSLSNQCTVSSSAHRAIQHGQTGGQLQRMQYLTRHHRHMHRSAFSRIHGKSDGFQSHGRPQRLKEESERQSGGRRQEIRSGQAGTSGRSPETGEIAES